MRDRLAIHPPPWGLVLYADGITPADALAKHDARQIQAIYYSYLEFGEAVLCTEEVWFVLAAVREKQLKRFDGYLTTLLSFLFDRFFF